MLKEANTLQTAKKEKAQGGEGYVLMKHLLNEKELNGKCGLFSQVTIPVGCTLGYHEHHGESETYYILSGEGIYQDNGIEYPVKAGDVTFTPSGSGHGLKNCADEDLVFMALIIKD
ncbi:MAG: cupin domain-containing protein [Lachnospiraceae bacterium]